MNTTPDPRYAAPARPLLLDVVREHIRTRHLSLRTEKSYVHWIRFYVRFHNRRHPRDLGAQDVKDVSTTMIYTHVLNRGGHGVRSPLDAG